MDTEKILKTFFRQDETSLSSSVSGILNQEDSAELLKVKRAFESEKNVRGGCSACRLRALTGKYRPIVSSLLNTFNQKYSAVKAEQNGLTPTADGKFLNEHGQEVNEKGETKRQNRRRRRREARQRRRK